VNAVFRYRRSIRASYNRQGYIYFISKHYKALEPSKKAVIVELCKQVCGDNWQALLERVTTGASSVEICRKHNIQSWTTIDRAVTAYYEQFPERL
jgi:hypothetical protein